MAKKFKWRKLKPWKKCALAVILLVAISIVCLIIFSPYKYYSNNKYRSVDFTVVINSPVDQVYSYLGNSENAKDWSSYVDHITVINPNIVQDGTVGSKRRCFKNKNEKGVYWDEEILEVQHNNRRRLSVYNLNGFSLQADGLETVQVYKKLGQNKTELTFSIYFTGDGPSYLDAFKIYTVSYTIRNIFKANLENIKKLNERTSNE